LFATQNLVDVLHGTPCVESKQQGIEGQRVTGWHALRG
jgi:hypothetical protein